MKRIDNLSEDMQSLTRTVNSNSIEITKTNAKILSQGDVIQKQGAQLEAMDKRLELLENRGLRSEQLGPPVPA